MPRKRKHQERLEMLGLGSEQKPETFQEHIEKLFAEGEKITNKKVLVVVEMECTWEPNRKSGNTISFMSMEAATLTNHATGEKVGTVYVQPVGGGMEIKVNETGESWEVRSGPLANALFNALDKDFVGPLQILKRLLELYDAGILGALSNGNTAPTGQDEGEVRGGELIAKLMENARRRLNDKED